MPDIQRETEPMIQLRHVTKVFTRGKQSVHALTDVSLDIMPGDIQGIIGFSGAGKSTLVRCINLLERPTFGVVRVDGQNLTELDESSLRATRRNIGMIFQQFNLMSSRTVASNVALALRHMSSAEKNDKVVELLKLVGLEQKARAYPSELSGGQKQRVAIARALANEPKVLLCDEATSALDPETTQDVLDLIKEINQKYGITVVVITHEMAVVKQICSSVAVMEAGRIVESGDIYDVFSSPKMPITRRFINTTSGIDQIKRDLLSNPEALPLPHGSRIVEFAYRQDSAGYALISSLSREFDIDINVIYGNMEFLCKKPLGHMLTIITGNETNIADAMQKAESGGTKTEVLYRA